MKQLWQQLFHIQNEHYTLKTFKTETELLTSCEISNSKGSWVFIWDFVRFWEQCHFSCDFAI